ncbi:hypothetical protein HYX12_02305, partial [Candidatus Woesearchaeota archaeon]|nr:hypothetical protein [Candidatus Woesearchaeota archaeon]
MIQWHCLPFGTGLSCEQTSELIDRHLAPRIYRLMPDCEKYDLNALVVEMKEKGRQFFAETTVITEWSHIPDEKKVMDWRYLSAVLVRDNNFDTDFGTYSEILDKANGKRKKTSSTKAFGLSALQQLLDEEPEERPNLPTTKDGGYTFIYALDAAVYFMEEGCYASQKKAAEFLRELLQGEAVYNALYLKEMLDFPERIGWQKSDGLLELARRINQNYAENKNRVGFLRGSFLKLEGEAEIANKFILTKPQRLELPHKLAVHAVDGQLGWRAWMTYDEIPIRTISNLSSIATYG